MRKLAIVATIAAIAVVIVAVGLASLKPKAEPESVNRLPDVRFDYDADNLTVEFDASASIDPDGSITNYSWSFGDGIEGFGVTVTHEYPANGTYTVTLKVTDNMNGENETSADVTVELTIVVEKRNPLAMIEVVTNENGTVTLSAAGSYDPDGGVIQSFVWSFEDGASAAGESVTHTFSENGTYTITLTVTDDEGAEGEASIEIVVTILSPPEPPTQYGPPGLLRAIENHQERVDEKPQLQNSLDHLLINLDRWLDKHSQP